MKLQIKIFLSAALLVLGITLSSFYFLNLRFSKVIKETINTHLNETQSVFVELIKNRQDLLFLLSSNIAESPKLKAALTETGADERTLTDQLLEFNQTSENVELFIIADPDGKVITCLLDGRTGSKDILVPYLESRISQMQEPKDVWLINDVLYQIAAAEIRTGAKTHGFFLLGDMVDKEFAELLKTMTNSDVTFIAGNTISGSTIIDDELSGGIEFVSSIRAIIDLTEEENERRTFHFAGRDHLVRAGEFPGRAGAQYLLSRPEESETEILTELRLVLILLGVVSVIAVFVLSYFMARRMTSPLNLLIEGTEDIASGNYNREILSFDDNESTNDEISFLAKSFEKMRNAIRSNIGKITDLNEELVKKNTELEQALDKLKTTQNELIQSEKLSAVGKMVSSIIHDFKSPMQVIKGMSELIAMPNIDEKKKGDLSNHIKLAIDQMNTMTLDILDFVRGETNLILVSVNLSKVLNELIVYMANDLQESNFQVKTDVKYDPEVRIDVFRIKRVFENLIRNAIEAAETNRELVISTERNNGNVRICIHDEGSGIPDDIIDSIFEPFVTKGKTGGTGLGLAISKKLIEDHSGTITARSEKGKGTTFIIELPCDVT